jgi:thioredoxin 1
MSRTRQIRSSEFEREALSPGVTVVDFSASWCPPCRALEPELEAVAETLHGQAKVFKIDVDSDPMLAQRFGVRGVPTVVVLKDGREVDRFVGAAPRSAILGRIAPHLKSA